LLAEAHVRATAEAQGVGDVGAPVSAGDGGSGIGVAMPFGAEAPDAPPVAVAVEHVDPFTGVRTMVQPEDSSATVTRRQSFVPMHARVLSTGGFAQIGTGNK